MALTSEQEQSIRFLKTKLTNVALEVKAILEQGRAISNDHTNLFLFKGMFTEAKPSLNSFNSIWDEIVEKFNSWGIPNIFPSKEDKQLQATIKKYYYECCAIYEMHMNPTPSASGTNSTVAAHNSTLNESRVVRARLPQINPPIFSGTLAEWPLFRDTYRSVIHDEPTLSNMEKFLFLVSYLRGPALGLVKGIELTETNYEQAWKLLNDNYNDKRRLANSYIKTLLEFVPFKTRPSANSLKYLLTTVVESIESFRKLKIPNADDFLLFLLLLRCLDSDTRRAFEKQQAKVEFPTCDSLIEFIRLEWRSLDLTAEEINGSQSSKSKFKSSNSYFQDKESKINSSLLAEQPCPSNTNEANQRSRNNAKIQSQCCPVCSFKHTLYQCSEFRKLSSVKKCQALKDWNGCQNCLSAKHSTDACSSQRRCQSCGQAHHSWLHIHPGRDQQHNTAPATPSNNEGLSLGGLCSQRDVLLGTAIIQVRDANGQFQKVRAVTDSGSQYSFITDSLAKKLGLKVESSPPNICGVGQSPLPGMLGRLQCTISSTSSSKTSQYLPTEAVVVKQITGNLPHSSLPPSVRDKFKSYVLADEEFWKPGPIEFLLGGDLFFDVVTGRPVKIDPSAPRLLPTIFGFLIAGPIKTNNQQSNVVSLLMETQEDMKEALNRFWAIEEVPKTPIVSVEDSLCEAHFVESHFRLPSGRYVVSLPAKETITELIDPKKQALSRFLNLESKLAKDNTLRKEYHQFMADYISLGHMKIAPFNSAAYTIPHHPVIKFNNGELKLRVVFDASCSANQGSLNDYLLAGPKLQRDITEIVSNFRIHPIAFTADIVKMYRQVLLNPSDRKYQHILWRFDESEEVQEYELSTVTYGEKSSSYLAQRVIHQLVHDEGHAYPLASRALLEDMYVDDIPTGAQSIDEAIILQKELIDLLNKGGFQLSKWASNSPQILSNLNQMQISDASVSLSEEEDSRIKLLGIQWFPKEDIFSYEISTPKFHPTKRAILSAIARMYDPLGYLSPIIFLAKHILQETWISKHGWDDLVTSETSNKWHVFLSELHFLSSIKIPRCVTSSNDQSYSIVGFCDASQRGYAAVLYLFVNTTNGYRAHLIRAKTKLAPIKPISIPRLELCGALLLARLFKSSQAFMKRLNITRARFFTDSQVVLAWLSYPPEKLNVFVAHRVVEVVDITQGHQWDFVKSQDNPADCSSRGLMPSEIINNSLWWAGPTWFSIPEAQWPSQERKTDITIPEEKIRKTALATFNESPILEWMERFSSYMKLLRSVAYILRFISKLKGKTFLRGPITVPEIRTAMKVCIKSVQHAYRSSERNIDKSEYKSFRSLRAFSDDDGLLRVGGRLQQSSLHYDAKHPYIIPGKSHFARLLVDHFHRTYLHLGPTALQSILSSKFWIISARNLIRQRIFKCAICYKTTRSPQVPIMGNLPYYRLQEGQVFTYVGVDLAGPFTIRESLRRKAAVGKAYLCLFICMSTKAIHLELVSNCSTDAFMAAFNRFIARRGKPVHVYSDCGTNFVGAANRLREMLLLLKSREAQNQIVQRAADLEIQWSFNPPSAPHFGGIWEAGIKSCKTILYKVVSDSALTFEEFTTLFCRIEAILNSRPLVAPDSDPNGQDCLTPGHFLIGRPIIAPPEEQLSSSLNLLQRWKIIKQKSQHFWDRWRKEYLHQLQQRRKWIKDVETLNVGDLVIIKEPNSPERHWPMARVIEVHPGKDGVVRVATIRTTSGIYKRPLSKLVSLTPITDSHV